MMGARSDGETDITAVFGTAIPGSNPGRGTRKRREQHAIMSPSSGYGSMVEHLVANQMMGVRFSLPAHRFDAVKYGR